MPDCNTIWAFREQLKEGDVVKQLFDKFTKLLAQNNLIVNKGKIIDASIIEVPIQRNSREENKQIKEGTVPKAWKLSPNKLSHKDTQAKWRSNPRLWDRFAPLP